jgi:hypothetical protein
MDLSFSLHPREGMRVAVGIATFADINAAAAERRSLMTGRRAENLLRDQEGVHDPVWILACALAPESAGSAEVALLGGSFSPRVARQLMVGETR